MSTSSKRQRLSGTEQRPRIVNEAVRVVQQLLDKIWHGDGTTGTEWSPDTSGGLALGSTSRMWSNLFLASGGVINWNNGNATLTQSSGLLTANVPVSLGVSNALTCGTIELGHATDTTLSRASAGDVNIEGHIVYRAGGTKVPVTDGGTNTGSFTAYGVLCGGTSSTGTLQSLAALGSSGDFLTSNGAGALPSFQTPVSQKWVLLNTLTANNSGTTLSDTSSLTATYNAYEIVFSNLIPATNSVTAEFQIHASSAFQNTNYLGMISYVNSAGSTGSLTSASYFPFSATTDVYNAGGGLSGTLRFYNPSQSASHKLVTYFLCYERAGGGAALFASGGGYWNGSTAAIDGFQFTFSAGNITSGSIKVYGIL